MIADDPAAPRDVLEVVLELQDQIIGIQAQLDEMHDRIDAFERPRGAERGPLARVRAGARRVRGAAGPRSQPSA